MSRQPEKRPFGTTFLGLRNSTPEERLDVVGRWTTAQVVKEFGVDVTTAEQAIAYSKQRREALLAQFKTCFGEETTRDFLLKAQQSREAASDYLKSLRYKLLKTGMMVSFAAGLALLLTFGVGGARNASAAAPEPDQPTVAPTNREDDEVLDSENSSIPDQTNSGNGTGDNPESVLQKTQTPTGATNIGETTPITETGTTTETLDLSFQPLEITLNLTGTLYTASGYRAKTVHAGETVTATNGLAIDQKTGNLLIQLDSDSYIRIATNDTYSNPLNAISIENLPNLVGFSFNTKGVREKGEKEQVQVVANIPMNLRSSTEIGANNVVLDDTGNRITVSGEFTGTLTTKENGDIWAGITDPNTGRTGYIAISLNGQPFARVDSEPGIGGPIGIDWPVILSKISQAIPELTGRLSLIFGKPANIPTESGVTINPEPQAIAVLVTSEPGSGALHEIAVLIEATPNGYNVTPLTTDEEVGRAIKEAVEAVLSGEGRKLELASAPDLEQAPSSEILNTQYQTPDGIVRSGHELNLSSSAGLIIVTDKGLIDRRYETAANNRRPESQPDKEAGQYISLNPAVPNAEKRLALAMKIIRAELKKNLEKLPLSDNLEGSTKAAVERFVSGASPLKVIVLASDIKRNEMLTTKATPYGIATYDINTGFLELSSDASGALVLYYSPALGDDGELTGRSNPVMFIFDALLTTAELSSIGQKSNITGDTSFVSTAYRAIFSEDKNDELNYQLPPLSFFSK